MISAVWTEYKWWRRSRSEPPILVGQRRGVMAASGITRRLLLLPLFFMAENFSSVQSCRSYSRGCRGSSCKTDSGLPSAVKADAKSRRKVPFVYPVSVNAAGYLLRQFRLSTLDTQQRPQLGFQPSGHKSALLNSCANWAVGWFKNFLKSLTFPWLAGCKIWSRSSVSSTLFYPGNTEDLKTSGEWLDWWKKSYFCLIYFVFFHFYE